MIRYVLNWFYIAIALIYLPITVTNAEPLRGHKIAPAKPHEFPFVASLGIKRPIPTVERGHICTGALITIKHVITAAHCVEDKNVNDIDVIVGEVDLRIATYKYDVYSWVTYNDWALKRAIDFEYKENDVAIVKLSSTVNQEGVVPVSLTDWNVKQLQNTNAMVVGWGVTNEGKLADILQKGKVTILSQEVCENRLKLITNLRIVIHKNSMCTSADPYTLTGCGDSGGPLLDKNNELLAITRSTCPNNHWGGFNPDFVNQYKVNLHSSVDYYRKFIQDEAKVAAKRKFDYN